MAAGALLKNISQDKEQMHLTELVKASLSKAIKHLVGKLV